MALLKNKIKVNKISLDLSNYYYYLRGVEKSGKTTLARDLILELYGDASKGLLMAVGNEKGYKALDNIQAIDIESWADFSEAIEDLIENKNEYGIKFIFVDTLDELVELAEKEVIRQSVIETKKECKSLNSALGGYGAGRKRLCQIVDEKLSDLKHAGYGLFVIGHTKLKTIKEAGANDEQEYQVLTSNLNSDFSNVVGHKADVIATIMTERAVNDNKRVSDTKNYIYFRGNGFVEAGSRFGNIVEKTELSAKNFIKAIEDAIKNSSSVPVDEIEFEVEKEKEVKENQKKAEQFIESRKQKEEPESTEDTEEKRQQLIKDITSKFKSGTPDQKAEVKNLLNGTKLVDAELSVLNQIIKLF